MAAVSWPHDLSGTVYSQRQDQVAPLSVTFEESYGLPGQDDQAMPVPSTETAICSLILSRLPGEYITKSYGFKDMVSSGKGTSFIFRDEDSTDGFSFSRWDHLTVDCPLE